MTTFQIKLIAITSMVIDHIGLFFFPHILLFRIIGRLAFPLFAWLIANGAYYSKNTNHYLTRLFLFALGAQIPFILINRLIDPSFWELNVLFTLFLGLAAIVLMSKAKNILLAILIVVTSAIMAIILNTDYSALGVLTVIAFYLSFKNIKKMIILQSCIFIIFDIIPTLILVALNRISHAAIPIMAFPLCWQSCLAVRLQLSLAFPSGFATLDFIEPLGLCSLFLIAFYRNQEGRKMKYIFYWFYPMHLLLFYIIKLLA